MILLLVDWERGYQLYFSLAIFDHGMRGGVDRERTSYRDPTDKSALHVSPSGADALLLLLVRSLCGCGPDDAYPGARSFQCQLYLVRILSGCPDWPLHEALSQRGCAAAPAILVRNCVALCYGAGCLRQPMEFFPFPYSASRLSRSLDRWSNFKLARFPALGSPSRSESRLLHVRISPRLELRNGKLSTFSCKCSPRIFHGQCIRERIWPIDLRCVRFLPGHADMGHLADSPGAQTETCIAHAAAGAGALVLLTPYLSGLARSSSNVEGGGAVFSIAVREMIPPNGLLSSGFFRHLDSTHPFLARNVANTILLAPGYAVELGFFFIIFLIYLVPSWRGRPPLSPAHRSLVVISIATLTAVTFIRSTVIQSNDFGWRGALLLQFALLLLASEVVTGWNRAGAEPSKSDPQTLPVARRNSCERWVRLP